MCTVINPRKLHDIQKQIDIAYALINSGATKCQEEATRLAKEKMNNGDR